MNAARPITVLHLSDMQFGRNHRFGVAITPEGDNPYDTLRERLILDLEKLRQDEVIPDLMIMTGDLAEWGRKPEFDGVFDLIVGLEKELLLPRARVIVIPGNHDINRDACEAYFKECSADDLSPVKPYWPKWRHYTHFFGQLYRDIPQYVFSEEQYWTLFEIEALKVVVAGLNSTIAESHRDEDHYGWVGEPQLRWFAQKLDSYRREGWLRIGVIHHNVVRGAELDDENLRDANDLKRVLGTHLNCVLHGHTHEADMSFWIDQNIPTLSTGSAAVEHKARPLEVPNQYQIIQFWPDRIVRRSRAYDSRGKEWIPDARIR
jgi:3',5'-cyclic AMP phosphodiesterase CpdA